jgi:hypothetical protein
LKYSGFEARKNTIKRHSEAKQRSEEQSSDVIKTHFYPSPKAKAAI